jgi:hypothetical protein
MSEVNPNDARVVQLTQRSCDSLERLALIQGADGIASLAAKNPFTAYMCIRTKWRRTFNIGSLQIVKLTDTSIHGVSLELDGKHNSTAIKEWLDGYLPPLTSIEEPLHVVLLALSNPTLMDRVRGRSLTTLDEVRADFVVPPFEI